MTALHWSAGYVGLPWADLGRDRSGCDCWGLARLVYAEQLGIDLPSYAGGYLCAAEAAEIDALVRGALDVGPWREVTVAREFDLVLFRRGPYDAHIGIVVAPGLMLHMMGLDAAKIEALSGPQWARRLRGIWRHEAVEGASKALETLGRTPV